jgi:hypothetical protein
VKVVLIWDESMPIVSFEAALSGLKATMWVVSPSPLCFRCSNLLSWILLVNLAKPICIVLDVFCHHVQYVKTFTS